MNLLATILLIFFSSACLAEDALEMRQMLQKNFDACNNENIEELMNTFSVDTPGREEFRSESEKLFKEKDIYYRLVDFKVIDIDRNYATAMVIQESHTQDRTSSNEREEFFRNGTTLLTKKERVRYKVAFKKDDGVWKCYLTLTEPVECESSR